MSAPPPAVPAAAPPWRRLHPLSPLLRGGRLLVVAAAVLIRQSLQTLSADGRDALPYLAAVPVVGVYALVQWRTTRWRVEDGDLRLETGVLLRRSRRVPLARLQAVDIVRPLLARLTGLAELRLEVVGTSGTEAGLAYLSGAEAERVRAELLRLAAPAPSSTAGEQPVTAGQQPAPSGQQPAHARAAPGTRRVLAAVHPGVLLASVLLSGPALLALLATVALLVTAVLGPAGAAPALFGSLLPALLGTAGVAYRGFSREYGFQLLETPDGLEVRHGLVETRTQSVPLDRVQGLRLVEPALWRLLPGTRDWVRVQVVVAGYRSGRRRDGRGEETDVLLPVGPRWLAGGIVSRVLPGVTVDQPTPSRPPRRARWRAPLSWHRLGLAVGDTVTETTSGVLSRVVDLVPHAKVQSHRLTQGPWQRVLRLATLHLDVAGRPLRAGAHHRDVAEAGAVLADLRRRSRAARAARAPAPAAAAPAPATPAVIPAVIPAI